MLKEKRKRKKKDKNKHTVKGKKSNIKQETKGNCWTERRRGRRDNMEEETQNMKRRWSIKGLNTNIKLNKTIGAKRIWETAQKGK